VAWRNHSPPCSAEVKEVVELYLYSPSGFSWYVLGWTSSFSFAPSPVPQLLCILNQFNSA